MTVRCRPHAIRIRRSASAPLRGIANCGSSIRNYAQAIRRIVSYICTPFEERTRALDGPGCVPLAWRRPRLRIAPKKSPTRLNILVWQRFSPLFSPSTWPRTDIPVSTRWILNTKPHRKSLLINPFGGVVPFSCPSTGRLVAGLPSEAGTVGEVMHSFSPGSNRATTTPKISPVPGLSGHVPEAHLA
jgi:hypothetical protein